MDNSPQQQNIRVILYAYVRDRLYKTIHHKGVRLMKHWVVIKFNTGRVVIWRDYDQAWGSPIYEVMDYFNEYRAAQAYARTIRR